MRLKAILLLTMLALITSLSAKVGATDYVVVKQTPAPAEAEVYPGSTFWISVTLENHDSEFQSWVSCQLKRLDLKKDILCEDFTPLPPANRGHRATASIRMSVPVNLSPGDYGINFALTNRAGNPLYSKGKPIGCLIKVLPGPAPKGWLAPGMPEQSIKKSKARKK